MGQGLGLALHRAGHEVVLVSRTRHPVVAPLRLHAGDRGDAVRPAELLLLATPDDAVPVVARELAAEGAVHAGQIVLHLSGLLDRQALSALAPTGAGLGSFHPLQSVADPETAPDRLRGSYVGIEGDERALAAARRLGSALGLVPVELAAGSKAAYHAGAVVAANYLVVLSSVAGRMAQEAGIDPALAERIYLPLMQGVAANLERGSVAALTGPVRRGDVRTIQAHLASLGPDDRALYKCLGRAALDLAIRAGLPPDAAAAVGEVLDEPPV